MTDETGRQSPCRAWVEVVGTEGTRLFEPRNTPLATPYARDRSFSCDGTFEIEVPMGELVVHIEKGKEYLPRDLEIPAVSAADANTAATLPIKAQLQRWVDMPSQGWYSADMHVHLGFDNPRVLQQLALADDVHVIPAFSYWLRGRGEPWLTDWPSADHVLATLIDARHIVSRNHLEIERIKGTAAPGSEVGATFLFNLRNPITAEKYGEYFPTDTELCRVARSMSPASVFDSDKPSWAETVVQAALGQLDTIQVCHNHYHRNATLAGGWGMIGPLSPGESNYAAGDGLFHRTNALYYRLLNCGFRLGVSGGSAIGVMPVPAGFHRVYAHLDQEFNSENFWKAVKAGRTFATTGPMLSLVADASEVGDTLQFDSRDNESSVVATVRSVENLESIEIIQNGQILASQDLRPRAANPVLEAELRASVTFETSGWIAARVLFRSPDGLLRQAHTSPIYARVEGQPMNSSEDARYMLQWMKRLIDIAESNPDRFPSVEIQQAVLSTYSEARAVYERLAGENHVAKE